MKKAAILLLALLLMTGCSVQSPAAEDRGTGVSHSSEGRALSDGTVDLFVRPSETAVQITEENLKTNTQNIVVSAGGIGGQAKFFLYLYHADDPDTLILYAILSAHDPGRNSPI